MTNSFLSCNATTGSCTGGCGWCGWSALGSGGFIANGAASFENVTIARNSNNGLYRSGGALTVVNSIVFENDAQSITGTATVTYSDVEGTPVQTGVGIINFDPAFSTGNGCGPIPLEAVFGSPSIDAGDPATSWNDVCFPPSRGTVRNDMGAHGGGPACAWSPHEVVLSFLSDGRLSWLRTITATTYSIYRGTFGNGTFTYNHGCWISGLVTNHWLDTEAPERGFYYLVVARDSNGREGSAGVASDGTPRACSGVCP